MRQVFSRWPSLAATSAAGSAARPDVLPAWMTAPASRTWRLVACDLALSTALVVVPAISAAIATWLALGGGRGAVLAGTLMLSLIGAAIWMVARLAAARRRGEARYQAIFERAGVSMWREDWTAAGEAVMALRRAGISDLESYFADRPDDLRALKARVVIKDVNAFTLEETGASGKEAYVGPLDRLLPDTDQTFVQWLVAFARGDRFFRSEAHVTAADGTEIDTLFTAMLPRDPAGFSEIVVTSLDVTTYKRAQARLVAIEAEAGRRSRISTANTLSASIAHEVNSPLAAILANAQAAQRFLRLAPPDMEEAGAALGDVVAQAARARDVVARLTSHFGNAPQSFAAVDLVKAARTANMLVEGDLRRHGAVVHLAAEDGLPPAFADLVQIQQVFVNLMLNAAQAMSGQSGRRDITVRMRAEDASILVAVGDTGPGVAPESREAIFEPFHSTKSDGMGMGLAICRNCIEAHGGDIWVDGEPGRGAAFHFTLPTAHG